MTSPVPFPKRSGAVLASDDLTAWEGSGDWVASGDAVIVDCWGGTDTVVLDVAMLGFWGSDPGVEQDPASRGTKLTRTFTGLPANRYVRVSVDVSFSFADFGAAGKPVGLYVNDVLFAPNVSASGSALGNDGQCVGFGTTDGSGELDVAFGCEDITVSCDLRIAFDDVEIAPVDAEFADIIIDSAVAWMAGNPTSITRGSLTFDAGEEWENYPFPGKAMAVAGLDEVVRSKPVIRGQMMMTGEQQFELIYRPGGAWTDETTAGGQAAEGVRTYTPGAFRSPLSTSALIPQLMVIWKRLRGDYIAVEFPYALNTQFGIGSGDADEGLIPVEFEARQDLSSATPKTGVPYLVHILPSTFEFSE